MLSSQHKHFQKMQPFFLCLTNQSIEVNSHATHPTHFSFVSKIKQLCFKPCDAISFIHYTSITLQCFVALHHLSLIAVTFISAHCTTSQQKPFLILYRNPAIALRGFDVTLPAQFAFVGFTKLQKQSHHTANISIPLQAALLLLISFSQPLAFLLCYR